MLRPIPLTPWLGLVLLIPAAMIARPASADTVYTNKTAFLSVLQPGDFVETFNRFPVNQLVFSPHVFSIRNSTFTFTASSPGGLYGVAPHAAKPSNHALSTFNNTDPLTLDFSASPTPITAVGGQFFQTDNSGLLTGGAVYLTLSDGTSLRLVPSLSSPGGFLGVTSTTPILSLTESLALGSQLNGNFPTVDNLYVGQATPEPGTLTVFALASAALLALAWRKRRTA